MTIDFKTGILILPMLTGGLGAVFGVGVMVQRYQSKVNSVCKAVFDQDTGGVKLMSKSDCADARGGCGERRQTARGDQVRELQNIHAAIRNIQSRMDAQEKQNAARFAAMAEKITAAPITTAETLSNMGWRPREGG